VNDGVERGEFLVVGENYGGQSFAIDLHRMRG
jgi:hypothetical protein